MIFMFYRILSPSKINCIVSFRHEILNVLLKVKRNGVSILENKIIEVEQHD